MTAAAPRPGRRIVHGGSSPGPVSSPSRRSTCRRRARCRRGYHLFRCNAGWGERPRYHRCRYSRGNTYPGLAETRLDALQGRRYNAVDRGPKTSGRTVLADQAREIFGGVAVGDLLQARLGLLALRVRAGGIDAAEQQGRVFLDPPLEAELLQRDELKRRSGMALATRERRDPRRGAGRAQAIGEAAARDEGLRGGACSSGGRSSQANRARWAPTASPSTAPRPAWCDRKAARGFRASVPTGGAAAALRRWATAPPGSRCLRIGGSRGCRGPRSCCGCTGRPSR